MERLQAALEKARASRGESSTPQTGAPQKARPVRSSAIEEAWQAIPIQTTRPDRLRTKRIVAHSAGREAASVDLLRTKMLQQMRQNAWRKVAVTSPGTACGKTTVAVNLAASLARQSELKTVLIDLDLRRPSMAKLLGLKDRLSFFDVVAGRVPFVEQAVRLNENVIVSVNTAPSPEPSEILASSAMKRTLDEIDATYRPDIIMFDMPPMLVTDDNLAFFDKVDCALLVVAAESTTIAQVDVCERDLASQTSLLGVILNKCRYTNASGYEYGGY